MVRSHSQEIGSGFVAARGFPFAANLRLAENSRLGSKGKTRTLASGCAAPKSQTTQRDSWHLSGGTASVPSVYLYDGFGARANVIEETDNSANILARYTQTFHVDEPLAGLFSGTSSYYEGDGLGSATSLSNAAGVLANTYSYDSFGKLIFSTGSLVSPFQYTGREFDPETGIYSYRARYYDPSVGRFISEDPIRFAGSSDFYSYTQNRPTNAIDPTGLTIWLCSRRGFQNIFPGGIGNHGFFYDDRNGDNCGKGDGNHPHGQDSPSNAGTFCVPVPGSSGQEDNLMKCCREKSDSSWWARHFIFPPLYDCQTMASDCLAEAGLSNPGFPGGRLNCPGNCRGKLDLSQPIVTQRRSQ